MNENRQFDKSITFKSIAIALILIPINSFWIIQLEVIRYTHPTLIHPLSNVIFIVLILTTFSLLLRKIAPKLALSRGELLSVYVMLCITSSLCSHDMMEILVTILGHPFRFATPENEWRDLFWRELPQWLTVRDERVLTAYYEGNSSLYISQHIKAWLTPALWWITFIFMLLFVMLCINTILRKQWTERERLTYPIIQLPLEMTSVRSGFFKNGIMWMGFSIAATISIINFLNSIFPNAPYVPVKRRSISYLFTEKPWNAMGGVQLSFYPFVIGISFLIPLELLFSCWTFYWFYKMELVLGSVMGWRSLSRFPYDNEQAFGAYVGLLGFALWAGRSHLRQIAAYIFNFSRNSGRDRASPTTRDGASSALDGTATVHHIDDSTEPMPYRMAAVGLVLGMIFFTLFSYKAGMSLWVIPIFFGIYFLLATMIARLRAELGFLVHDLHNIDPNIVMTTSFGTRKLGASNLTVFSLYMFFNRAYRAHPMPQQLEAFKIAERANLNPRSFAGIIMLATGVGAIVTFWILLDGYYRHGAESGYYGPWALGFGRGVYGRLENWLNYPRGTDRPAVAFMGGGLLFTVAMLFMRTRFLWWPFHPLGYAMANSWGMYNLWSCLFVAWVIKWIVLRHGGLKSYRRAVPFFLGLALGDYAL
ncbi:hypothetical protein H8E77_22345, partial [bacterium]|nr:hypothetical protein [bacterium]